MTLKKRMKETTADINVRNMAQENSGRRLGEIVAQIEANLESLRILSEAAKITFNVAKSEGYDPVAIRRVIRERAMTDVQKAAARELYGVVEVYLAGLDLTAARELDGVVEVYLAGLDLTDET